MVSAWKTLIRTTCHEEHESFFHCKATISSYIPFGELTYPNLGKGKSSSKVPSKRDMLVPWRVNFPFWKTLFEELQYSLVSKDGNSKLSGQVYKSPAT